MLDERKGAILRAVIREYVRTGQPVGSKTVVDRAEVDVSSATIRNDMGILDEQGYVWQPYTSAGRIPTDRGYRWFIDNWPGAGWPELPRRDRRAIEDVFHSEFRGFEDALEETTQILSELTDATAVAVAPPSRQDRLSRLELLQRDDRRATWLLIADTGVVEQGIVEFERAKTDRELADLAGALTRELDGVSFGEIPGRLKRAREPVHPDPDRVRIAEEVEALVSNRSTEKVYRGGTANILQPDKFPDLTTAHEVVEALEEPLTLGRLIEAARKAGSMLIFIGREVPVEKMKACAVVFAPYEVRSNHRGTVGIIGPTRMDYPHTISAVESVARSLSDWLGSAGV